METHPSVNSILDSNQKILLEQLLDSTNDIQKAWLAGYLSGLNEGTSKLLAALTSDTPLQKSNSLPSNTTDEVLKIMYGTRSGNSKKLAQQAQKQAENFGISTEVVDLNDYDPKKIKQEKNILLIVSTDGEGEPTISTEEFYNYLFSKKSPVLKSLQYSVIALGDNNYEHFCKVGRDLDNRLSELGAKRVFDRIDCDVDFENDASEWILNNLQVQKDLLGNSNGEHSSTVKLKTTTKVGTKDSPYSAAIFDKILLNGKGSTKSTWHLELSIEDSGITYSPGDSLGVVSKNKPAFIDFFTSELNFNPSEKVSVNNSELLLGDVLSNHFEVTTLAPSVVKDFAEASNNPKLKELAQNSTELFSYCYGRDVLDLIQDYKLELSAQELVNNLRTLQPRLYSIASSYNYNPDEVHVTVAKVEYQRSERLRKGVASNFLADIGEDENVDIFIDENIGFRLPKDASTPIIMIGAGTGIAPFRAFMQERSLSPSASKNWLFFGDRSFTTDFLYQTEWLKYHKSGLLTHIDLAFSRDQEEKIYVQHKLVEKRKELYEWIQEGANIYLCGDKNNMAKDVKSTLVNIFRTEGGYSEGDAYDYLRELRRNKQFQEDVY